VSNITPPLTGDTSYRPGKGGEFVVITIEDEEEWPEERVQLSVKVKVDCWGRVKAGRTKLNDEDIKELAPPTLTGVVVGLGKVVEISDNETSSRERLGSSTLHTANEDDDPDDNIRDDFEMI
jgi:hypothetical protein